MATNASTYLNELLAKYTPSSTYFDAARLHRSSIQTRLDLRLGVHEMFETGSLRHGTGVKYFSDVDYIVSLKGSRPTPTTALTKVRDALQDRFANTTVRVSRPAVVCDFANGTETVEVVPAYAVDGGGYWIPDPKTGEWMKTHPKDHNAYVNLANQRHSGGAKKLARLAKTWKYKRTVPVSSFYLEMRAAKYAEVDKSWYLPLELYYYLNSLKIASLGAMNDPTGLGSRFNAYSSDTTKADALSKLDRAVGRALKAKDYWLAGKNDDAISQYKLLFGQ